MVIWRCDDVYQPGVELFMRTVGGSCKNITKVICKRKKGCLFIHIWTFPLPEHPYHHHRHLDNNKLTVYAAKGDSLFCSNNNSLMTIATLGQHFDYCLQLSFDFLWKWWNRTACISPTTYGGLDFKSSHNFFLQMYECEVFEYGETKDCKNKADCLEVMVSDYWGCFCPTVQTDLNGVMIPHHQSWISTDRARGIVATGLVEKWLTSTVKGAPSFGFC